MVRVKVVPKSGQGVARIVPWAGRGRARAGPKSGKDQVMGRVWVGLGLGFSRTRVGS